MTKAKTTPPLTPPADNNIPPATTTPLPPAPPQAPQVDVAELAKAVSELQKLLNTALSSNDALQRTIVEQQEQIKFIAGRVKSDEWDNKKKAGKGSRIVRLRKYEDKFVVGWSKMTENWASNKNPSKVWQENLRTNLFLEDGTQVEVDYAAFSVNCAFEDAEVQKVSTIESPIEGVSPDITFTLRTKDGKELIVNSRFVN